MHLQSVVQPCGNSSTLRAWATAATLFAIGCGGSAQSAKAASVAPVAATPAPAPPPAPETITAKERHGDSTDPHAAALERLINAPWGQRTDKADALRVPMPDADNWKRVRYYGVEHYVGFRYGDDHHAMLIAFVQDLPAGTPMKSDTCMRHFEAWGLPQTHAFDVKFSPFESHLARWQSQSLESRSVDGKVNLGFTADEFSGAWAAYPAYQDACLVLAVAVPWREHQDLAQKLRDRFVSEGFQLMKTASDVKPERH